MSRKAFAERERSLQEYHERERSRPIQVDPDRIRQVDFQPEDKVMDSTKQGNIKSIEKLIKKYGKDVLNYHNSDGITPLHLSILDENHEVFNFLVKNGADVNSIDRGLWTPLHLAVNRGDIDLIKTLLDQKSIDLLAVDIDGKLIMDTVTEDPKESESIKKILRDYHKKNNVKEEDFVKSKEKGEKEMLQLIQESHSKGYDMNQRNKEGATILHVAISRGYYECSEYLLKVCKVNPNIADDDGWTPLHCACCWNRAQFVGLLRKYSADFNKVTLTGQLPQDMTTDPHTLNAIATAKIEATKTRSMAQQRWSKVRTSIKLVIMLKNMKKAPRGPTLRRTSSLTKRATQKSDMKRESLTMKNTRLSNSVHEEEASKISTSTTTSGATLDPTEAAKKRRRRRATGQVVGPTLVISGVTDREIQVSWEEFNADFFKITYEIEGDPSSLKVFAEQFTGSSFVLNNLKPNTLYAINVLPNVADAFLTNLESTISVTTSEI